MPQQSPPERDLAMPRSPSPTVDQGRFPGTRDFKRKGEKEKKWKEDAKGIMHSVDELAHLGVH
ncbi:hypothetical protein COLO4_24471 [Corchorus olitorius]|uniref:Uncharacterized protein n=1 Tax=Corchorus olitorius TaxID=93759 RepID=A0A1R3I9V1_9ROSI|nr:hypothetical protein COLO4_24471 [Corchorus olitorius]